MKPLRIYGGWDPREAIGYAVCEFSLIRRTSKPVAVFPMMEKPLRRAGLYSRPHQYRDGQLFDVISDAPMATEFANSRFLVPFLAQEGWALFCDFADMLFLGDVADLFALADPSKAVMVVKHDHQPAEAIKMDGQQQTAYSRKNWSSVVLWNCDHPANKRLTEEMVNSLPGRNLHRFCWLDESDIGELPMEWNVLVGVQQPTTPARLLHYTLGGPFMAGYENGPYADVWLNERAIMNGLRGNPSSWPKVA